MAFHVLIGLVFILSIFFGILIWCQTIGFERKALVARKRRDEFMEQFIAEQELVEEFPVVAKKEEPNSRD